jgi:hypothetical protein
MPSGNYRLIVRHGSSVRRESYESLDSAVAAMSAAAEQVRAQGPLETVRGLREFEPGERVAARIELSTGGWLRGREAGVDVMGDGSIVPFAGGWRRRQLVPADGGSAVEAVRRELAG